MLGGRGEWEAGNRVGSESSWTEGTRKMCGSKTEGKTALKGECERAQPMNESRLPGLKA